ncbi:MAG: hypothetical protein Q4D42_03050 [Eubacteriales bacterium]|nr:hypothetical protein [Eubacteriales bacterium]
MEALDDIASASPMRKMFLDHAREQYYSDMQNLIGSAVAKALGG